MQQVFDQAGKAYSLKDKIGAGAQGEVFPVESMPDRVVKVFFPKFLAGDDGRNLRAKLDALIGKHLGAQLPEVAWPEFLVFDGNRQWIGYAMKRVTGVSLADHALTLKRLLQQGNVIDRLTLSDMALAFLTTLRRLHAADVWVGDFNPGNFLFDQEQRRIAFIDADSYQVAAGGGQFKCPLTTPGMTAPEYLNIRMTWQWRSPESELFSGAIVVFLILMTGKHPFDARGMENHQESLAKSGFPYRPRGEKPTGRIPAGDIWETVWNDFPQSLQQAFYDIFFRGHRQPEQRGTPERLLAAVADYRQRLLSGQGISVLNVKAPRVPLPAPAAARPVHQVREEQSVRAENAPLSPRLTAGAGTPSAAPDKAAGTDIAEPSLWQRSKPKSLWGRVVWWLVG